MGREKIRIYLVDHDLNKKKPDENGKNLKDLVKVLEAKGYSVKVELFPDSLSEDFDFLILHPPMERYGELISFHSKHPEIPMIFCSRIDTKNEGLKRYPRFMLEEYLSYKNKADGTYDLGYIAIKPFLEFIKYLSGKNKIGFNTNI